MHHVRGDGSIAWAESADVDESAGGGLCDKRGGDGSERERNCDGSVTGQRSPGGGVELSEHECIRGGDGRIEQYTSSGHGGKGVSRNIVKCHLE